MIAAWVLGLLLVVALPWRALSKSRSGKPASGKPPRSRTRRYLETIAEIAALLMGLGLVVYLHDAGAADLGLGWPPAAAGRIGLVIAAVLIIGLLGAVLFLKPKRGSVREQEAMAELPQSRDETLAYLAFTPFAGFGWEILYRGFLLWWLTPLVGIVGAVVIASVAYGLAHGWKGRAQGLGSIVSAFLFTIGYAVTGSLWWLIAVHTALPLIGLLAGRRARTIQAEAQPA
ncbi:MAG: CPBP family intramembrane glutamic endopeptidase [Sphingomicrobium sp.]